jgi:hypothetical protein
MGDWIDRVEADQATELDSEFLFSFSGRRKVEICTRRYQS